MSFHPVQSGLLLCLVTLLSLGAVPAYAQETSEKDEAPQDTVDSAVNNTIDKQE